MDVTKFSLISNLAKKETAEETSDSNNRQATFATAMNTLGYTSVFDIVRRAKPAFVRDLARLSSADGSRAYDNAMCYAIQIVRAYREQLISSGQKQTLTQRSGVRSLVDIGPSFPNLFRENWDTFCKVGAIEAMDSPVAYLASLYRFATQQLEGNTPETNRISLDVRRPDLRELLIDQQSTFTPVSTLSIINTLLESVIREYVNNDSNLDNGKAPYELIAEKRHPFLFPYTYSHHEITLGLSEKKTTLGEMNYRSSQALPFSGAGNNLYGATAHTAPSVAQCWLSGLSSEQQVLLTEPSLFADYYIPHGQLTGVAWHAGGSLSLLTWENTDVGYLIFPETGSQLECTALILVKPGDTTGWAILNLGKNDTTTGSKIRLYGYQSNPEKYFKPNNPETTPGSEKSLRVQYLSADNDNLPFPEITEPSLHSFVVKVVAPTPGDDITYSSLFDLKVTLSLSYYLPDDYQLTEVQMGFFKKNYGTTVPYAQANPLIRIKSFLEKTGLNTAELESLLAQKSYAPTCSANCLPVNPLFKSGEFKFPQALHYGASYVNGVGGRDPGTVNFDKNNNSMDLALVADEQNISSWQLTNASLNRFDRLQRMIRLQRWMGIPFAELDTLIMAAVHSEREKNLGRVLNTNTLRALGTYRYLSKRYSLAPEEFAAFMHHLTPFAAGSRKPLFDKVFNTPQLFDTPLVIDGAEFSINEPDPAAQKTILQLCAGLGVQPTESSFGVLANDVSNFMPPLGDAGIQAPLALKRSLPVVSSFYRQARIAEMFGLSIEDSRRLLYLLGGDTYIRQVVTGRLSPHPGVAQEESDAVADILDILMQMDWASGWLKKTGQTASDLDRYTGNLPDEAMVTPLLLDTLETLAKSAIQVQLNESQLAELSLPPAAGWWGILDKWIDVNGFVKAIPLESLHGPVDYFSFEIGQYVGDNYDMGSEIYQDTVCKLTNFVVRGYYRQHQLIEELLQTITQLPRDRTEGVIRWSTSSSELLGKLLNAVPYSFNTFDPTLLNLLKPVFRRSEIIQRWNVSAQALQTFLIHPDWLSSDEQCQVPDLRLNTIYIIDCYTRWVNQAGMSEDRLLDYFRLANETPDVEPEEYIQRCAVELAVLIGWTACEVMQAFSELPEHLAKSMAQVDWILRVHSVSQETGLAVGPLLKATHLSLTSAATDWQLVSEGVMAAVRR
ncbi:Tc toxin subunit A [Pseudomonas sp. CCI4.2]|uniref:Tc toxin subunit A n=1 Tax=Pseudomonas sp. CCI4.2 TaxID=3048620 RepID=UPI002AC8C24D|nr:Tc toxin subunit A [Pseudomonas sp. CCI4.2]MEB0091113.1 Tc toxin subunit A [Pseudomonas sp. CCI4.2]WPX56010.1 Tc toxin subunit A [Pseudomonas sp. CCI4.2]